MIGRRVNTSVPEQSLLLKKAVGAVPHTGGKRFDQDSEYYQTLLRWIELNTSASFRNGSLAPINSA